MTDEANRVDISACSFKLLEVRTFARLQDVFLNRQNTSSLLVMSRASSSIEINGKQIELAAGLILALACPEACSLRFSADAEASGYELVFYWLCPDENGKTFRPISCPDAWASALQADDLWLQQVKEMELLLQSGQVADELRAQARLHMLLAWLYQQEAHDEQRKTIAERLQASVDYMEEHYSENITREQLAAVAGLHPDYYSRAFKKHFHSSPIRYLTKVRMRYAKSRLLYGNEPVKTIAYDLGFNDEFYFSRKFKAQMGVSPAVYVKRLRQGEKIASLNHLTTGHLLALSMTPYAAVLNDAFQAGEQLEQVLSIGQFTPKMDKLMDARPEIIITRGNREEEYSPRMRQLNQIAPTLKLDFQQGWREHLQEIARAVNKQREASGWLERYEEKALQLGRSIRKKLGSERVLLLGINGSGQLYLFGQRNLGGVLYHDLGMEMPEGVASISHYKRVSLEQLESYETERILLVSFQNDGKPLTNQRISVHLKQLASSTQWNHLPAIQQGKLYSLLESGHLCTSYNPWSHDLLLDFIHRNFA